MNRLICLLPALCLAVSACDDATAPEGITVEILSTPDAASSPTFDATAGDPRLRPVMRSVPGAPVFPLAPPEPPLAPMTAPASMPDQDGDGIIDAIDVCPEVPDPEQHDSDGDGVGDGCDPCTAVGDEVCNGADDDCDGVTDEGLLNACGACGAVPDEVCDGEDNDCDGATDEALLNACGACGAVPDEVCDGLDNDCDGATDEGLRNACGGCGPAPVELCNDMDDDCDGAIDERFPSLGIPCSYGAGVCNGGRGAIICTPDGQALTCSAPMREPEGEEVCDGRDNDCDGRTDETFNAGQPCSAGQGACAAHGVYTCNDAGDGTFCPVDAGVPALEICDLIDNDCDGSTDEFVPDAWRNACGRCGPVPEETCNGVDDDCDGVTDEGFDLGGACVAALSDICVRHGEAICASPVRAACSVDAPSIAECRAEHRHALALGREFSCLARDGRLYCWGGWWGHLARETLGDTPGEVGRDMPVIDLGMPVASIAVSGDAGCALSTRGEVKCWGQNVAGQAGQGDRARRGDVDDYGEALPPIPLGMHVEQIDMQGTRVCAVSDTGHLKCWGGNPSGTALQGDDAIGDAPGEIEALRPIDLGMPIREVAVGGGFICALGTEGGVKCWGDGDVLASGGAQDRRPALDEAAGLPFARLDMDVIDIDANRGMACAVDVDGRVKCWGHMPTGIQIRTEVLGDSPDEVEARLPVIPFTIDAIGVSTSGRTICAWDADGIVECTGMRQHEGLVTPLYPVERVATGMHVIALEQTIWHVCALGLEGGVKCWGDNRVSQLGTGDAFPRSPEQVEAMPALSF